MSRYEQTNKRDAGFSQAHLRVHGISAPAQQTLPVPEWSREHRKLDHAYTMADVDAVSIWVPDPHRMSDVLEGQLWHEHRLGGSVANVEGERKLIADVQRSASLIVLEVKPQHAIDAYIQHGSQTINAVEVRKSIVRTLLLAHSTPIPLLVGRSGSLLSVYRINLDASITPLMENITFQQYGEFLRGVHNKERY